ncbi:uncharacterized protein LOC115453325 [Manduca sexta]|uniref:uncharacterized protein LOC115453325 n=1 Tax=Manduca sexta TaxID=7130 RepID=UPI00188F1AFF|nr:uncharacterized protein LOC115453325 [Manduca sexta]
MQAITKVSLYRSPYTICYISEDFFVLPDEQIYKNVGLEAGDCCEIKITDERTRKRKYLKLCTSALFLKPFVKETARSPAFRANLLSNLNKSSGYPSSGTVFLKLVLEPPDKEIIDYAWNERILTLVWTRVEIENAFSWLSTLGGAYSALGDYFEHCAEEAGRISIRQYKLSKMLGDDGLAARSCLYSALSYSQKGDLSLARHIVRTVAKFARRTHDKRLMRMCQGVWAKLLYLKSLKGSAQGKTESNNGMVVRTMS